MYDTVTIKQGQFIFIHNRTYKLNVDTTLLIPASVKYEIKTSRSDEFYNRIEKRSQRNRFLRELHNKFLVCQEKKANNDTVKTNNAPAPLTIYSGKTIRHIVIKRLDVFGPTILDTTKTTGTWIGKTGNKIHSKSRLFLLRSNLIFKEGDALNPVKLADNERLLRGLPYIEDASITVQPIKNSNDSIDILVITKDVWSGAFDISLDNIYSGKLKFWDNNILGLGQEIENDLLWKAKEEKMWGYAGHYTIDNISGSFVKGTLGYNTGFNSNGLNLNFTRTFFTPDIKYAGGINLMGKKSIIYDTIPLRFHSYGMWLGRSFQLNNHENFTKIRQNITITGNLMYNRFYQRPVVAKNVNYIYQDKLTLLTSLTYSHQSYYKGNLIYNFGRTEDIPIGGQASITMGIENNEFNFRRNYLGTSASLGLLIRHFGYCNFNLAMGSFFDLSGHSEQSVVSSYINYFSPLINIHKFKVRQFSNIQFISGENRFKNEYLTVNKSSGILGFDNDSLRGTSKFNWHWETVCFSPFYFYNFRFVFFAYADHSWLSYNTHKLFDNMPYTGWGFGIRIRNERLVFNTIQLRFSFYPNIPKNSTTNQINISGESVLSPPTFLAQPAALIPFN